MAVNNNNNNDNIVKFWRFEKKDPGFYNKMAADNDIILNSDSGF